MKKMIQKARKNNKGFSLVELIIVIAIMAILVGILAPTLIKYVENSRKASDEKAVDEVRSAIESALADEAVYDKVVSTTAATYTVNFSDAGYAWVGSPDEVLTDAVTEVVPAAKAKMKSKAYKTSGKILITVDRVAMTATTEKK